MCGRHGISMLPFAARRLDVDPCTLAKWEHGKRVPTGAFLGRVEQFLDLEGAPESERGAT